MRTWSLVGGVVFVLGLAACSDAAAKDTVKQPAELLVTISLGPDSTLDSLRTFANAVRPGAGAALTPALVRKTLGEISGADSIDGLDPTAPIYVLVVDGGAQLKGAAVVGKVVDEKALVGGLGGAQSVINKGWAVIGPKAVVLKVAPFALATLPSKPAVSSPTAMLYVPQALRRYRTEIDAARKQAAMRMAAAQSSAQMTAMMQAYLDGLYSLLVDSDQLLVTLDVTNDLGAIDIAMVPKAGSRLAKFVAAQRPSDYALLAKLPAMPAPLLLAGQIDSGPYRQGLLDVFATMYGQAGTKELIDAMGAVMKASTGEVATVMQMGAGKPMAMTQVFGVADHKAVDKAIDHLLELFKAGRTFDGMGVSTTIKTNTSTLDHDGVSLKGYDVTHDYSKAAPGTRATMEKMFPSGTPMTARIATFDQLGLVTMGGADPAVAIDASRGRGSRLAPTAAVADFITGSRARKESLVVVMDFGAITGIAGPARTMIMSAGFADRTAHLRITVPASTIRAISGQP